MGARIYDASAPVAQLAEQSAFNRPEKVRVLPGAHLRALGALRSDRWRAIARRPAGMSTPTTRRCSASGTGRGGRTAACREARQCRSRARRSSRCRRAATRATSRDARGGVLAGDRPAARRLVRGPRERRGDALLGRAAVDREPHRLHRGADEGEGEGERGHGDGRLPDLVSAPDRRGRDRRDPGLARQPPRPLDHRPLDPVPGRLLRHRQRASRSTRTPDGAPQSGYSRRSSTRPGR